MRGEFNHQDEDRLREQFFARQRQRWNWAAAQRSSIRRTCQAYRRAYPDDSILNHTHSTEWVSTWQQQVSGLAPASRMNQLHHVSDWWRWLFEERLIDDNVFALVDCERLAVEALPPLVLQCNLQRLTAEHLCGLDRVGPESRRAYRAWLNRFNLFINRLPQGPRFEGDRLQLAEPTLAAWFRHLCSQYARRTVQFATNVLSGFFDTLATRGVLDENPLARLHRAYPTGGRLGVAYALASDNREASLAALAREPMFVSVLAEHLSGFVALKRAVGCRYLAAPRVLRDFDRFFVRHGNEGTITRSLLARWHASRPGLSPASHHSRSCLMHQFCLYLQRHKPGTYIPDPVLSRHPAFYPKANILQPETMRALLDAVPSVAPGSIFALRPHTHTTLLTLLYTTGLRISEALALRVTDVDLTGQLLVIHRSKFGKSRIVPFTDGLRSVLEDYHRVRQDLLGVPGDEAPFFIAQHGGHYSECAISNVWLLLLKATHLDGGKGQRPRIHDLRHSFATLRLLSWYREGADVEAKLPLLSTYLGHSSVQATQWYLTILPEIRLEASERFHRYGGALVCCDGGGHEFG